MFGRKFFLSPYVFYIYVFTFYLAQIFSFVFFECGFSFDFYRVFLLFFTCTLFENFSCGFYYRFYLSLAVIFCFVSNNLW